MGQRLWTVMRASLGKNGCADLHMDGPKVDVLGPARGIQRSAKMSEDEQKRGLDGPIDGRLVPY